MWNSIVPSADWKIYAKMLFSSFKCTPWTWFIECLLTLFVAIFLRSLHCAKKTKAIWKTEFKKCRFIVVTVAVIRIYFICMWILIDLISTIRFGKLRIKLSWISLIMATAFSNFGGLTKSSCLSDVREVEVWTEMFKTDSAIKFEFVCTECRQMSLPKWLSFSAINYAKKSDCMKK